MKPEISYADSGVDIDAADDAVSRLTPHAQSTFRPEVLSEVGGFGSVVAIPAGYKEPVLVSGNDGVGTKLLVAQKLGKLDTIGIDLVAMCVDDIVTSAAEPLFFLDQITVGAVNAAVIEQLVIGMAAGCSEAGCSLTGGEIAEHPGSMAADDIDISGFAVGVAERSEIPSHDAVVAGDVLVGIASPGIRCNGYSLARQVLMDDRSMDDPAWIGADRSIGDELLRPSVIYAPTVLQAFKGFGVRAAAHITGGGLAGNLRRVINDNVSIELDLNRWPRPRIFEEIASRGPVSEAEMRKVFNLGVGMVLVSPPEQAKPIIELANRNGHDAWLIGQIARGNGDVRWSEDG